MKIRDSISQWMEQQEARWRALPRDRQRKYTILLFALYLSISACVYIKYWCDAQSATKEMDFRHIENPVLKSKTLNWEKDTISQTFKR